MDQLNKLVTNVNCLLFSTSPRSGSAPTSAGKPPTSSGVRGDHCCSVGVVGQFVLYFGHLNYSNESEDIALYRDYMYRLLFINNRHCWHVWNKGVEFFLYGLYQATRWKFRCLWLYRCCLKFPDFLWVIKGSLWSVLSLWVQPLRHSICSSSRYFNYKQKYSVEIQWVKAVILYFYFLPLFLEVPD